MLPWLKAEIVSWIRQSNRIRTDSVIYGDCLGSPGGAMQEVVQSIVISGDLSHSSIDVDDVEFYCYQSNNHGPEAENLDVSPKIPSSLSPHEIPSPIPPSDGH